MSRQILGQVLACLLVIIPAGVSAQGADTLSTSRPDESPARHYIATGIVGTAYALTVVDAYMTWWKGAAKPFTWYHDAWFKNEHLGIDKVGHFYGTYALFKGVRTTLLWGGSAPSTAMWWGIGIGLFNALEIEIGDGFSPYGFDYTDLICGFLGVGYGVLQSQLPVLENINFKVSYWSKTGFKSPANFVNDYDAMTVWCAVTPHGLLPGELGRAWPAWLGIAVGYSPGNHEKWREFLFAVDINLGRIGFGQPDVDYAGRMLDLIHWPMPGLKVSPSASPEYQAFLLR
jgi:hypothetical protein